MHEEEDVLSLPGNTFGPCSSTFFIANNVATANEIPTSLAGQSSGSNDCSSTCVTRPPIVPESDVALMSNSPSFDKKDCGILSGGSECNMEEFSVPDCEFAFTDTT